MLRPQLLPDELAGSYLGALARLNVVNSSVPATRISVTHGLIAGWLRQQGRAAAGTPFERLAAAAGVSASQLLQHHTLRNLVTGSLSPDSPRFGTDSLRAELKLCSDCAAYDLDTYGRSYWRREHQLPGIFWCPKHKRGLNAVRNKDGFLAAPSSLVADSKEYDYDWVASLWSHKHISRYIDVLSAFLDAGEPIVAPVLRDALRVRAQPLGYQIHPNAGNVAAGTRSVLSHDVHKVFPAEWLAKTFTGFSASSGTKLQVWLDGTLWMPIPPTNAAGYALAVSILFPSGDVFMKAVRQQQLESESSHEPSGARKRGRKQVSTPKTSSSESRALTAEPQIPAVPVFGPHGRRNWTMRQKASLVQRTYEPGMSVKLVAEEAGVVVRVLYKWIKLERAGAFAALIGESDSNELVSPELAAARAEIARLRRIVADLTHKNETLVKAMTFATERS